MIGINRFSIVVPTRHRVDTLKSMLRTCLDQKDFDAYEIVISDNSDDNDTQRYIEQVISEDARARRLVRYGRPPAVCCMSDNFDHAIGRACGEYLIVLGDDDGMLPMALYEIDRLVRETGAAVIRWKNGLYNWPTMAIADAANYLGFSLTRSFTRVDGRSELAACLRNWNYERLPMLYVNSAVRADIVQSVRDEDGRLFHARSPDVYSAMVLAHACGDYLDVTAPFTLAGLSGHSNGVSSAFAGSNGIPRADFETLSNRGGYRPHPHVPNLAIYPMVALADSFLYAQAQHFPADGAFALSREELMRACVARADTDAAEVRRELLRSCEDDPELTQFTLDLIARKTETIPAQRLKPIHLGADGANLHLDAQEFGVTTIAGAVALVHQIVWPDGAPIRYDAPDLSGALIERTRALEKSLAALVTLREAFVERTEAQTLMLADLNDARSALAERNSDLTAALTELLALREALVERTEAQTSMLADSNDVRSILAERNSDLTVARAELVENRRVLAERSFNLAAALAELGDNRKALAERSSSLAAALAELGDNRRVLAERSSSLAAALAELGDNRRVLAERSSSLAAALAELGDNRSALAERSSSLAAALAELGDNRSALAERSSSLAAVLAELATLREALVERNEAHTSMLADLDGVRSTLAERNSDLAAALAELGDGRSAPAERGGDLATALATPTS